MPFKLILNKDGEEKAHEYEELESAFDAAEPWIMRGYIARMTDRQGVVQYTQTLASDQIVTYRGDATEIRPDVKKPWWKFW